MRETRAKTHLKEIMPRGTIFDRIENSVGSGMFDTNVICPNGFEFWYEMKQLEQLKSESPNSVYKIPLRPSQVAWAIQRLQNMANNLYVGIMIGSRLHVIRLTEPADVKRCRDGLTLYDLRLRDLTNSMWSLGLQSRGIV